MPSVFICVYPWFPIMGHTPSDPELVTDRLRLRRLVLEDAPGLHLAFSDADAMRFWDGPPSRRVDETEERIRRSLAADPSWHVAWAVLARQDDRFIGMVNYHGRQDAHRRSALGWILVPRYERQGYMAEAVRALLTHCFDTLRLHRIEAEIEPANTRSIRLAERLGFRNEGLLRDRVWVGGEPRSILMYALLRPEWSVPCL
jgi:ribosomal-protein-alanine N-acetyltransferase